MVPEVTAESPRAHRWRPRNCFRQGGALLEEHPGADPLEPLDDLAHAPVRAVRDQEVGMVACHLPGENRQFMFPRNLAQEIAGVEGHRPRSGRRTAG